MLALGRNGDRTCGCLLSWRERISISLVTKDFLRCRGVTIAVAVRGQLSTKPAVARFLRGSPSRAHEPLAAACPMFLSDCIGGARAVGLDENVW